MPPPQDQPPKQDVADLVDDVDRTFGKMYQSIDSLLAANKPTKGAVTDLANLSLQMNASLHRLQIAQRKARLQKRQQRHGTEQEEGEEKEQQQQQKKKASR